MNKEIIAGKKASELIKTVVIKLCDMVASTLGPKGKNAIIDSDYSEPYVTNDGVTIVKNIEFEPNEEAVAKIIKEASIKTGEMVGDGTTTSLVLLKSIYLESLKHVENGINPYAVKESLENSLKEICNRIINDSICTDDNSIASIASISSGNREVGTLIKEAYSKIGKNGIFLLEESNKEYNTCEVIEGMFIESGVVSSHMLKDRNLEESIDNPYILITDNKICNISELRNILELIKENSLLIIAEDFEEEVIDELIRYKALNINNIVCIKAPNYSENKCDILEDICVCTGASLISNMYNKSIEDISLTDLGNAKKVKITRNNTIIFKNNNDSKFLKDRIKGLKKLISKETSEYEKELLEMRLSNLSNGVALIYAGGKTHSEMILNKLRIEDAICAVKSALKYGFSIGGGKEFYNISKTLNNNSIGNMILSTSLKGPIKKIITNSGNDYSKVLRELNNKNIKIGYDASINKIVDLEASGILDPTEVLIETIKNAISISNLLLTTDLIIVTKNKKEEKNITEIL